MNEIPPRFGQPLELPRKERDPEVEKIHTDKDASAVALEQIKSHITTGGRCRRRQCPSGGFLIL